MNRAITIRLTDDLALWLDERARKTGVPAARIVREILEEAQAADRSRWLRHAGKISGPVDLSQRKGYSRQ